MRKILFTLLSFSLLTTLVNAECDYEMQNKIRTDAATVKVDYEIEQLVGDHNGNVHPEISREEAMNQDSYYSFVDVVHLNITNITDNIYIVLENANEGIKKTYTTANASDGIIRFDVPDTFEIREYVIKVYSNISCSKDQELRTISVKTPMYNEYSNMLACKNSDKYYCQKYVTTEITMDESEILSTYNVKENNEVEEVQNKNVGKIVAISSLIIIIVIGVVMYNRQKRQSIWGEFR